MEVRIPDKNEKIISMKNNRIISDPTFSNIYMLPVNHQVQVINDVKIGFKEEEVKWGGINECIIQLVLEDEISPSCEFVDPFKIEYFWLQVDKNKYIFYLENGTETKVLCDGIEFYFEYNIGIIDLPENCFIQTNHVTFQTVINHKERFLVYFPERENFPLPRDYYDEDENFNSTLTDLVFDPALSKRIIRKPQRARVFPQVAGMRRIPVTNRKTHSIQQKKKVETKTNLKQAGKRTHIESHRIVPGKAKDNFDDHPAFKNYQPIDYDNHPAPSQEVNKNSTIPKSSTTDKPLSYTTYRATLVLTTKQPGNMNTKISAHTNKNITTEISGNHVSDVIQTTKVEKKFPQINRSPTTVSKAISEETTAVVKTGGILVTNGLGNSISESMKKIKNKYFDEMKYFNGLLGIIGLSCNHLSLLIIRCGFRIIKRICCSLVPTADEVEMQ